MVLDENIKITEVYCRSRALDYFRFIEGIEWVFCLTQRFSQETEHLVWLIEVFELPEFELSIVYCNGDN